MIIKMVNEFKLTVVHFAWRCRSVHAHGISAEKKTYGKSELATGPPGSRAAGPLGRRPAFSKNPLKSTSQNSLFSRL